MSTTSVITDEPYRDAMREHLAQIEDELAEVEALLRRGPLPMLAYRATERNLQLLIEACIGIAKQALKARQQHVPSDARQAFGKLRSLGLDATDTDWNRAVGMRNALVHDYLNLQPERIVEVIENGHYRGLFDFARQMLG